MTALEKRFVTNYAVLVMAKEKTWEEIPEDLREAVEIEIAKREIKILEAKQS